jgi:hypothetical protein
MASIENACDRIVTRLAKEPSHPDNPLQRYALVSDEEEEIYGRIKRQCSTSTGALKM